MGGAQGGLGMAGLAHVLERLAERRPIFHSEADFQHAFAWQIQIEMPSAAIRLETRPFVDRRVYLDVAVTLGDHRVAIELKHLTRGISVQIGGEAFNLADQSAHDIARYDAVKDISRVEQLITADLADSGYVVVLTNDAAYWRPGWKATVADASFRFHEGRELAGSLEWGTTAGPGTTRGREAPIALAGRYIARWADYSVVAEGSAGQFRYLLMEARPGEVPASEAASTARTVEPPRPVEPAAVGVDQTCRMQILDAMAALEQRHGRTTFEIREIVDEVQRRGSQLAVTTIRTFIVSVMCVDAPPNHPTRYPDLRRVGRGQYERVKVTTVTVPASVRNVVQTWRDAGRPMQRGIVWPKCNWIETFPAHRKFLGRLPERLARSDVRAACLSARQNDAAAQQAFLAVMAWGYGNVGYGRWRTQEIFRNNPAAASDLVAVAATVVSDGALAGYRKLANEHQLDGLGPSFGTKYLYFCPQLSEQHPALILDRLVGEWLRGHTDLGANTTLWSSRTYARYIQQMWAWADELGEPADVLEECMFTEQARERGNQWA